MQVTIGGVAVAVRAGSLDIEDKIEERSSASFTVVSALGTHYQKGQPVEIQDNSSTVIFAGFVEDSQEAVVGSPSARLQHSIRCADMHYLADKRIVATTYAMQTCGAIVADLIANWLTEEGISAGTVGTGPTIEGLRFNYVTASDVMNKLCELSGYTWWLSFDKELNFIDPGAVTAPWALTASDVLKGSSNLSAEAPEYRNRQFGKGWKKTTDPITEQFKGDGAMTTFTVAYPIAAQPTVTVNTVAKTVGIKQVEVGHDWYWSKNDRSIVQDSAGTKLTSSDTLEIVYTGFFPAVAILEDPGEVASRQSIEGGSTSGYVDAVMDIPEVESTAEAAQVVAQKLARYGVVGKRLTFATKRSGLRPGQLLTTTISEHGLSADEFLITSVRAVDVPAKEAGASVVFYNVEAVEGPASQSWVKFFDRIIRGPAVLVEFENEDTETATVILQKSSSESWAWAESATPAVTACPVVGASLYPSASLYPC